MTPLKHTNTGNCNNRQATPYIQQRLQTVTYIYIYLYLSNLSNYYYYYKRAHIWRELLKRIYSAGCGVL